MLIFVFCFSGFFNWPINVWPHDGVCVLLRTRRTRNICLYSLHVDYQIKHSWFQVYWMRKLQQLWSSVLIIMQLLPNYSSSWRNLCIISRGCLNIKMLSYQYRDPHVKVKTVSTALSLTWEFPYIGKTVLKLRCTCIILCVIIIKWCSFFIPQVDTIINYNWS